MNIPNAQLLAMAVDLAKTAIIPTGNNCLRVIEEPEKTAKFIQAIYEKLIELNSTNNAN